MSSSQDEIKKKMMQSLWYSAAEMKAALEAGIDPDTVCSNGATFLINSIIYSSMEVEVAQMLMDAGASLEATDSTGNTALIAAAQWGNLGVARILLDRGANVHARNKAGATALFICKSAEVARLLIQHGADVNTCTDIGNTALISSVLFGRTEIVRALLEAGADIEGKGMSKGTALIYSCSPAITRLLLDYGANINVQDENGLTPAGYAADRDNKEIAQMLAEETERREKQRLKKIAEGTHAKALHEQAALRQKRPDFKLGRNK